MVGKCGERTFQTTVLYIPSNLLSRHNMSCHSQKLFGVSRMQLPVHAVLIKAQKYTL